MYYKTTKVPLFLHKQHILDFTFKIKKYSIYHNQYVQIIVTTRYHSFREMLKVTNYDTNVFDI